jgi:GNAT superfamily N-acetyltransferase
VTTPDLDFVVTEGRQAGSALAELLAAHAEVYAESPYRWSEDDHARFEQRLEVWCRQPGFVLAQARHGQYLVGFGCGLPLRPSTDWWRDVTTTLPADLTSEYQGRTFAVTDLLVRAPWRRQGIGETLYRLLLRGRSEERATALVLSAAGPAQGAFGDWGWRKVARKQESAPGSPVLDVLVRSLPAGGG